MTTTPQTSPATQRHVDYVELGATDLGATKAFYAAAFGWQFTDYGPGYAAIRSADGQEDVGGLNGDAEPGTGSTLLLIRTPDLDATHAAVVAAGGEIADAPYDYPGGRRFTFADPSGNVLGAYQPAG